MFGKTMKLITSGSSKVIMDCVVLRVIASNSVVFFLTGTVHSVQPCSDLVSPLLSPTSLVGSKPLAWSASSEPKASVQPFDKDKLIVNTSHVKPTSLRANILSTLSRNCSWCVTRTTILSANSPLMHLQCNNG